MIFPWLNNNMRCFEIVLEITVHNSELGLNNNMRCFEIAGNILLSHPIER